VGVVKEPKRYVGQPAGIRFGRQFRRNGEQPSRVIGAVAEVAAGTVEVCVFDDSDLVSQPGQVLQRW